ncbi:hypothetical protein L1887_38034 [Cichorium endivia]|nr:hypothetical protein L1887_38034 [Cichorium endivia]
MDSVEVDNSKIGKVADNSVGIDEVEETHENDDSTSRVDGIETVGHVSCDVDADRVIRLSKGYEGDIGPSENFDLGLDKNGASYVEPNNSFNNSIPDLNIGIGLNGVNSSGSTKTAGRELNTEETSIRRRKAPSLRSFPHSIRFKDMVMASQSKSLRSRTQYCRSKSKSGDENEDPASINSIDKEIENTVELGEKLVIT